MSTIGLHLLPSRVTIQRKTRTPDTQGGHTETFAAHLTNVPFRISSPSASDRLVGNRSDAEVSHVGYAMATVDIIRDDRVIRGAETYRVLARLPPSLAHHLKVTLQQIQQGT